MGSVTITFISGSLLILLGLIVVRYRRKITAFKSAPYEYMPNLRDRVFGSASKAAKAYAYYPWILASILISLGVILIIGAASGAYTILNGAR